MARISSYANDGIINGTDQIIGTDNRAGQNGATTNFTIDSLGSYYSENAVIDPSQIGFLFDATLDEITFTGDGPTYDNVTSITISRDTRDGYRIETQAIAERLFQGYWLKVVSAVDVDRTNFAYFRITTVEATGTTYILTIGESVSDYITSGQFATEGLVSITPIISTGGTAVLPADVLRGRFNLTDNGLQIIGFTPTGENTLTFPETTGERGADGIDGTDGMDGTSVTITSAEVINAGDDRIGTLVDNTLVELDDTFITFSDASIVLIKRGNTGDAGADALDGLEGPFNVSIFRRSVTALVARPVLTWTRFSPTLTGTDAALWTLNSIPAADPDLAGTDTAFESRARFVPTRDGATTITFWGLPVEVGSQGPAGVDGVAGTNGISAYQQWLDAGNTGTEAEFLTSLIGPTGNPGNNGLDGGDGAAVRSGAIVPTAATTGFEGDFYIDVATDMIYGPRASGDGANVWGDPTSLVGVMGSAGAQGPQGSYDVTIYRRSPVVPDAPADGAVITDGVLVTPPTGWSITRGGTIGTDPVYIAKFTFNPDDPRQPRTNWVGPDLAGTDGARGPAGPAGSAAGYGDINAFNVALEDDGTLGIADVIVGRADPEAVTLRFGIPVGLTGEQGEQGVPGDTGGMGDPGLRGDAGDAGADGDPGEDGIGSIGPKGDPGTTGTPGTAGTPGQRGATGLQGNDGDRGPQGPFTIEVFRNSETVLVAADAPVDGVISAVGIITTLPVGWFAQPGDDTAAGLSYETRFLFNPGAIDTTPDWGTPFPIGAQGPTGPAGIPGDPGTPGTPGTAGVDGMNGLPGTPGTAGAAGAKGDKGETGDRGLVGMTGPKGDRGDVGATGVGQRGMVGPAGGPGAQGEAGPIGPVGPDVNYTASSGNGHVSFTLDTVTRNLTAKANAVINADLTGLSSGVGSSLTGPSAGVQSLAQEWVQTLNQITGVIDQPNQEIVIAGINIAQDPDIYISQGSIVRANGLSYQLRDVIYEAAPAYALNPYGDRIFLYLGTSTDALTITPLYGQRNDDELGTAYSDPSLWLELTPGGRRVAAGLNENVYVAPDDIIEIDRTFLLRNISGVPQSSIRSDFFNAGNFMIPSALVWTFVSFTTGAGISISSQGAISADAVPYDGTNLATGFLRGGDFSTTATTLTFPGGEFSPMTGGNNGEVNVQTDWSETNPGADSYILDNPFAVIPLIDNLGDVDTTTAEPILNQILVWNGTNWVPEDRTFNFHKRVFGGRIRVNDASQEVAVGGNTFVVDLSGVNTGFTYVITASSSGLNNLFDDGVIAADMQSVTFTSSGVGTADLSINVTSTDTQAMPDTVVPEPVMDVRVTVIAIETRVDFLYGAIQDVILQTDPLSVLSTLTDGGSITTTEMITIQAMVSGDRPVIAVDASTTLQVFADPAHSQLYAIPETLANFHGYKIYQDHAFDAIDYPFYIIIS